MGPIHRLAPHIFAAAALSAFAASSALASPYVILKAQDSASPGLAGKGEHIEIESFSWGSTNAAGPMKPVFVKSWSTSGDADAPSALPGKRTPPTVTLKRGMTRSTEMTGGGKAESDMVTKGSRVGENNAAGFHGRGIDIAAVDGEPVNPAGASRRATGDPDRPIIAGNVPNRSATPRQKGSVWIRVSSPWAGCRIGARYPTLELSDGGQRYILQDVTVANCGGSGGAKDRPTEEVAFYYNKIAFSHSR